MPIPRLPRPRAAKFLLAQCHFDLHQMEAAVSHFKAALDNATEVPDLEDHIHYKLGLAFEALNNPGEATSYFQKIEGRADLFPDVTLRLQRLA